MFRNQTAEADRVQFVLASRLAHTGDEMTIEQRKKLCPCGCGAPAFNSGLVFQDGMDTTDAVQGKLDSRVSRDLVAGFNVSQESLALLIANHTTKERE